MTTTLNTRYYNLVLRRRTARIAAESDIAVSFAQYKRLYAAEQRAVQQYARHCQMTGAVFCWLQIAPIEAKEVAPQGDDDTAGEAGSDPDANGNAVYPAVLARMPESGLAYAIAGAADADDWDTFMAIYDELQQRKDDTALEYEVGEDGAAGDIGGTFKPDFSRFDRMTKEQMYEELVTSHHAQRGDFPMIFSALVAREGGNRKAVARAFSRMVGQMQDYQRGDDDSEGDNGAETPANAAVSPADAITAAMATQLAQDAQTAFNPFSVAVETLEYGDVFMTSAGFKLFALGTNARGFALALDNLYGTAEIVEGRVTFLYHSRKSSPIFTPAYMAWLAAEPKRQYRSFEDLRYTDEWIAWYEAGARFRDDALLEQMNAAIFAPREQGAF